MNTKPLALLMLTFSLLACNSGAPPTTRPGTTPTPATPPSASPAQSAPPTTPSPSLPAPAPTDPPAGIDGRDFLSIAVVVNGAPFALVPNTVIRLGFHNGQISASAGCNTFGGGYRVDGDRLMVDGGGMTEMGCDQPRHAQDDWLFGFLGADPQVALDGDDLVMTSSDGSTEITLLDREVAQPDQPLTGRTWTLSSIITGEAVSSVPIGVVANIEFMADGTVKLNPGCNSAGGRYTVEADSITFADLVTTDMACMGAAGQVEAAVLSVLNGQSVTFSIDAGNLTLMFGDLGLQFTAG